MSSDIQLYLGNCLEVMQTMGENSVDTIITDPPYGLSEDVSVEGLSQRVYDALVKIGFPNLYERNAESFKGSDFAGVTRDGSDLGIVNGAIGEKTGIGVPKSAVNLHRDRTTDQEIHNGNVPSRSGIANGILANEVNAESSHFLGDFILQLGDMSTLDSARNVPDSCLAEVFFSGFAVPIFASVAPSVPGSNASSMTVVIANEDVGYCDNALGMPHAAPCVVTLPGTVNTLMLRFDSSGRPIELLATHRASHLATIGEFGGAQLVRAFPTASGLASIAEPHRVRFVALATDGTYAIYQFHLWVPRNVDIKRIIPRGGFMGKGWDATLPDPQVWREALRVAKPGATMLIFGGTRTWHRLAVDIENAGWILRDTLMFLHGQGFPKSHDISKAIDKAAGAEREVVGSYIARGFSETSPTEDGRNMWAAGEVIDKATPITIPATEYAKTWDGYGTALKPAWEPVILAMKPLDGTFAQNALRHGVAGLNIDGARIDANGESLARPFGYGGISGQQLNAIPHGTITGTGLTGRWPANLLLDEEAAAMLDAQSGISKSSDSPRNNSRTIGGNGKYGGGIAMVTGGHADSGGASRFFYVAKASKAERNAGLDDMDERNRDASRNASQPSMNGGEGNPYNRGAKPVTNHHPTVKPIALMRYLVRLTATPTGGIVLDPFCGSGSTGIAAVMEKRSFIGIDIDGDYLEIAKRRIAHAQKEADIVPTAKTGDGEKESADLPLFGGQQ